MSKAIKQMQMDVLKRDFQGVRDMVIMNVVGLSATADNTIRLGLRKKGIRMQMVKNSLARRIFADAGLNVTKVWEGATTVAWGGNSIADLSKELEGIIKKNDKFMKVKTAVADGQEITFDVALKMPTRTEAIAAVLALAQGAGSRLVSAIVGPGSTLASQLKSIEDKGDKGGEPEAAPAEPAPSA